MEKQKWKLEDIESFQVRDIFECGQCFRWNQIEDKRYIGIFQGNVLEVKQTEDAIYFEGYLQGDIQTICTQYFDLNRDYTQIKKQLEKVDNYIQESISYGKGMRLLNQDLWETIISFIISANNNIPRIKGIIERISKAYGEIIEFKGKSYYTFPTPEQLAKATIEDLRALGLGFRDKRVYEMTRLVVEGKVDLEKLQKMQTNEVREILLTFPGVGPKVADCILLFSLLKRLEVFPIDVWVRRVMNDLYIQDPEESKIKKEEIEKLAIQKYGNLAGIAQQYLFYWRREQDKTA